MPRSVYSNVGRDGMSRFNPQLLVKRFAVSVIAMAMVLLGSATMASATTAVSSVTVAANTTAAGAFAQWTVSFTPGSTLTAGTAGSVTVNFPSTFSIPSAPLVTTTGMGTGCTGTGLGDTVTVSGQQVVLSWVVATSACNYTSGAATTISIGAPFSTPNTSTNSITNPAAGALTAANFTVADGTDTAGSATTAPTILATSYVGATATQTGQDTSGNQTATVTYTADGADATYTITGQNWTSGAGVALSGAETVCSALTGSPALGTAESCAVSGLTVGDSYKFTVTPSLTTGTSGFVAQTTSLFTTSAALAKPTAANAGSGAATISFTADGVATLYTVNSLNVTSGTAVAAPNTCSVAFASPDTAGHSEQCTITGLTNGGSYEFTVTPSGNSTTSTVSPASASLSIGAAIGTPTVTLAGSDGGTNTVQVLASWTADGVATLYTVTAYSGSTAVTTCSVQNTSAAPTGTQSCLLTGLAESTAYTVKVAPSGNSTSSSTSAAANITTASTPTLGAPTAASGGLDAAKVSFATDGSATSYTVNAFSNGGSGSTYTTSTTLNCVVANTTTAPSGMQSCTVTSLNSTSGYSYEFTVTPSGGNGLSQVSAKSAAFTASGVLAAPTAAATSATAVKVTFTADGVDTLYTVNGWLASSTSTKEGVTCYVANSSTPPTGTQSCTVTGLTAGGTYVFNVAPSAPSPSTATGAGTSGFTAALTTGSVIGGVSATADGSGAIKVTFTPDGVATSYLVNAYVGNSTTATAQSCTVVNTVTPPTTSANCVVTGLSNGVGYTFTVTPSGNGTTSTVSAQTSTAVATGAALATPTAVTAGHAAATVSFVADGVATIYTVNSYLDTSGTIASSATSHCTVANSTTPPTGAQSCTLTGLNDTSVYVFTVTPSGNGTVSSVSADSATLTATAQLAQPTVANAGSGAVKVSFTADGAATTYTVTAYNGATASNTCVVANTTTAPSGAQNCTVTGLTNGTSYTFKVAPSGGGSSTTSAASALILVGTTFLATPTPSFGGTGAALVTFTADGVASTYTVSSASAVVPSGVTAAQGSCTVINSTTAPTGTQSCTVNGLTNGVSYTFTVTPTGNGTTSLVSPASAAFLVSAAVAPSAPTAVTSTVTANSITVNWTAGASNGSALTGYIVTATAGNTTTSCGAVLGTATSCTISGLSAGTVYALSVQAANALGTSSAASASATTAAATVTPPPAAVFGLGAVHGFAVHGRIVTITMSGKGFYAAPKITSNAPGTRAFVVKDSGTLITIRVISGVNARGWHTFTVTLANGKSAKRNYLTK